MPRPRTRPAPDGASHAAGGRARRLRASKDLISPVKTFDRGDQAASSSAAQASRVWPTTNSAFQRLVTV
jgi:hypothetical protein